MNTWKSLINKIDNLDINIDKDDWLQCRLVPLAGSVDYPMIVLELAWRE